MALGRVEPETKIRNVSCRILVNKMREMATNHKTTIIMVTHDNKILDVADRIIIVDESALASKEAEEAFVGKMRDGSH